jgi:hypothetical protein
MLTRMVKRRVTGDIENLNINPLTEALEMVGLPSALPSENTTENFNLTKTLALIQLHLQINEALVTMNVAAHPHNKSRFILLVGHCRYLNTYRVVRLQYNTIRGCG